MAMAKCISMRMCNGNCNGDCNVNSYPDCDGHDYVYSYTYRNG